MSEGTLDIDAVLKRYRLTREEFAERLALSMQTIRSWSRGDRRPSLQVCMLAEEKLGIRKHELRPDIWPKQSRTRRLKVAA
jgi:transcriptional regulator with XRE-family HTH domain